MEKIDVTLLTEQELTLLKDEASQELNKRQRASKVAQKMDELLVTAMDNSGKSSGGKWSQPSGAHDSYPVKWVVSHKGKKWESMVTGNVWEPGTTGWREVSKDGAPMEWIQPLGAHDSYKRGEKVTHNGKTWVSNSPNNVWEPGTNDILWAEDVTTPPASEPEAPTAPAVSAWKQPAGAHDAYKKGDKVAYNGSTWTSNMNGNVWAPGIHGWTLA